MTRAFFKDPLWHFLLAGAALYLIFGRGGTDPNTDTIQVNATSLFPSIVAINPAITVSEAPEYLLHMDAGQREELIEEYVREEVLVREAKALGLNQEDFYQRRRMVSQLQYINEAFIADTGRITDAELSEWYEKHKDEYQIPAQASFTQVFVSIDPNIPDSAKARALSLLGSLNDNKIPAFRGPALGDHFLYRRNYVESEQQEIESHFGADFAGHLFAAEADSSLWQGPWQSDHGWHLVILSKQTPASTPPLADVTRRAQEDIMAERKHQASQSFYQIARNKYRILVQIEKETIDAD